MTLELKKVIKRVGKDVHIHETNLVLEEGRVVESGAHGELASAQGRYATLLKQGAVAA